MPKNKLATHANIQLKWVPNLIKTLNINKEKKEIFFIL